MKRITPILLALAAQACVEEPSPRGGEPIPVFWVDGRTDDEFGTFDRIEEACEYWSLLCVEDEDWTSSVMILLTDHGGLANDGTSKAGFTDYDDCTPTIWSAARGMTLEHEFGHAFTLEHVGDDTNIMFGSTAKGNDIATFAQRVQVEDAAADRCD